MGFTRVSRRELETSVGNNALQTGKSRVGSWSNYVHDLGIVGAWNSTKGRVAASVQMDGSMVTQSGGSGFAISIGKSSYDLISDRILMHLLSNYSPNGYMYWLNPDIFTHASDKFDGWAPGTPQAYNNMMRVTDRWLRVNGNNMLSCPLDRSTDWAIEFSGIFTSGYNDSYQDLMPSGEGGIVWVSDLHGRVAKYDFVNKARIGSGNFRVRKATDLETRHRTHYAPELGVFLVCSHRGDYNYPTYVDVVVPEVEPYALSNPTPVATPAVGKATKFQVTLTGDFGEPAEGFLVDWSIIGGAGNLVPAQSTTDENGVAETYYVAPSSPTSLTIQAEVTF